MIILHIAQISTDISSGLSAIVPKHVENQAKFVNVALLNINNIKIENVNQLDYQGVDNFPNYLNKPFNKPDLIIFHGTNYFEYIKIYKILIKKNIPYIIIPHGESSKTALRKKWLKKKIAYLLFFNRFINNAKAIQFLSINEKNNSKFNKKSNFISTNGIKFPKIYKTSFNKNCTKLIYIGRLEVKIKGLDLLLKAIFNIKQFMIKNNVSLEIYGPDYRGRYAKVESIIKKYNLQNIVSLNNAIFDNDKINKLLESDLFIQTSRSEGMPLGIIEALGYGLPCILTKGTALMDDILNYDCGYSAGSTMQNIADAIVTAIEDKVDWKKKSTNAINYIKNNYNWEEISKNAIQIYKQYIN